MYKSTIYRPNGITIEIKLCSYEYNIDISQSALWDWVLLLLVLEVRFVATSSVLLFSDILNAGLISNSICIQYCGIATFYFNLDKWSHFTTKR